MGNPAARTGDSTSHGTPLGPGPGSPNVFIGYRPAWRGIPIVAAPGLVAAQSMANTAMRIAEAASRAAAGTPAGPEVYAAEQLLKEELEISMGGAVSSFGGMSDIHVCPVPVPLPPHGPGVVIDGSPTVLINNMPAARMGDTVLEALGGPDKIATGCFNVLIGGGGGFGSMLSILPQIAAQIATLQDAAKSGTPFCEVCAKQSLAHAH